MRKRGIKESSKRLGKAKNKRERKTIPVESLATSQILARPFFRQCCGKTDSNRRWQDISDRKAKENPKRQERKSKFNKTGKH